MQDIIIKKKQAHYGVTSVQKFGYLLILPQCVVCFTFFHIDDTSTLTRCAPILKLLSNHDLSHTAAWAGHWLLGRPKQLYGTNHG